MAEVAAGSIDLLITDVVMPGMSGPALRREVAAKIPSIGVIFISGFAADTLEREGLDREREILLHKPFGREELLEAVRRVLGASMRSVGEGGGA
jgi:two-component system cell cycle sensor histidine kinase/response regulator CckA